MFATTEGAILKRVIQPDHGNLSPEAARAMLALDFPELDHLRMSELSAKASEGALTPAEQEELEGYINVSHFLSWLQSKARLSLKGRAHTPAA